MAERELVIEDGERLFALTNIYLNHDDRLQVMKAFEFARWKHGAQRRMTGELFLPTR